MISTDGMRKQKKNYAHHIWLHGDVVTAFAEGYESAASVHLADKEGLVEDAIRYLQRPWMQDDYLEWVMIDAIMFEEVLTFGEYVKEKISSDSHILLDRTYWEAKGSTKQIKSLLLKKGLKTLGLELFWLFVSPALFAFLFVLLKPEYSHNLFWGVPVYIIVLISYFFMRKDRRSRELEKIEKKLKDSELHAHMAADYNHLIQKVVDPAYFKEGLLRTTTLGAHWPDVIFPLLENAIRRDSPIWNHMGRPDEPL